MSIQDNAAPKKDQGKQRKLIRKKVAEILMNATDAGARVFPNASVPPWEEELPVILIYPRSEAAGKYAEAPRELERDLDLAIEIVAKGPEKDDGGDIPKNAKSLEDILDDIAEQIENAMDADETLQCTADDSILTNTEFEFDSAGGVPIGSARMTYSVLYYTMTGRKFATFPDFEQAQVDYNIGDDENTREAIDTIEPEII